MALGMETKNRNEIFSMKIYLADNVWIIERERIIIKNGIYNRLHSFFYKEKRSLKTVIDLIKK